MHVFAVTNHGSKQGFLPNTILIRSVGAAASLRSYSSNIDTKNSGSYITAHKCNEGQTYGTSHGYMPWFETSCQDMMSDNLSIAYAPISE